MFKYYLNSCFQLDLERKAENGMQKYQRTRPLPSAESIKRTKTELKHISPGLHPFFLDSQFFPKSAMGLGGAEQQILNKLRDWRPNQVGYPIPTIER
jgi:hypothetical protein